jgi:hypothetical protein
MTNKERISEIRNELKATFKGYKFSIRKDNWYGVFISILEAPYQMTQERYEQVNEFYIAQHYSGQTREDLLKINEIASRGVTYRETGDYGTQPDFYVSISIGNFNNPFKLK